MVGRKKGEYGKARKQALKHVLVMVAEPELFI